MNNVKIVLLALLVGFIASCSTDKPIKNLSNPDSIPGQLFDLKAGKDTVIATKGGIQVLIKKGTFDSDVKLEIKEALNLNEILFYGLTTMTADGKPLQTDGMFYINATDAAGKQPKINIPISVNVPANNILQNPKLFTGEKDENGFVKWTEPKDIKNGQAFNNIDLGESLFKTKCGSCHILKVPEMEGHGGNEHHMPLNSTAVAPNLLNLHKRRTFDWYKRFTLNPIKVLQEGDECAKCWVEHYKGAIMTAQNLNDAELDAVWKYIIKESNKASIDSATAASLVCSNEIEEKVYTKKQSNTKFNWSKEYKPVAIDTNSPVVTILEFEKKTTETQFYVYSISIPSFGWYNIDRYTTPDENGTEAKLDVTVLNENIFTTLNVVLVFENSYTTVLLKPQGNGKYGFGEKTYLPEEKISIYALGEKEDKLFYSLIKATVQNGNDKEMVIKGTLDLKPSTKEEIENTVDGVFKLEPKVKIHLVPCDQVKDSLKAAENLLP